MEPRYKQVDTNKNSENVGDGSQNSNSKNVTWILFLRQVINIWQQSQVQIYLYISSVSGTRIRGGAGTRIASPSPAYTGNVQAFVCSGVWTGFFVSGLGVGSTTVLVPQMRREANSTDFISDEMASWMTSSYHFSGIIWYPFVTIFLTWLGRKWTFTAVAFSATIYSIMFYLSSTPQSILVSEFISGLLMAANLSVSVTAVIEYSSPKYRGMFMTLKSASFSWGLWVSNAIGTFYHWKNIGILGTVLSMYMLLGGLIVWPESPCWLASKGRFEDCTKSHRWLKGTDETSEQELKEVIHSQKIYVNKKNRETKMKWRFIREFYKTLQNKEYLKTLGVAMASMGLYAFSGKLISAVYAIDIITKISNDEATAYTYMLILDGITVLSMYLGCILCRYIRRRTMLLCFSSLGILGLWILSLYLYLIRIAVISEDKLMSLMLLIFYSLTISCGPMILSTSIFAELAPIRFRSTYLFMTGFFLDILITTLFKTSPSIFKSIGLDGSFLFFGVTSAFFLSIMYKYLPETKDKNFREIENSFKTYPPIENTDSVLLGANK